MSNYLQTTIQQFNPYIQQLPVDAYIKVGMYKQQQYDEGVQKVQSYIDNIAGLPIMKQADKDYLNKKIGELTNQISEVAGADFSNKNLVGQIAGLSSKIGSDPNVLNAVASTAKIKELNDFYDNLYKTKPELYSEANRQYDAQYVNQYLTNGNIGEQYNGPTKGITGSADVVRKRLLDEISKFKEDKDTYIDGATGQLMYRISEREGISEDRVREYVQGTLSGQENELLHRDAWYNFRGIPDNNLVSTISRDYKNKLQSYQTQKRNYEDLANASQDADTKLAYQKKITGLSRAIDDITANTITLDSLNSKSVLNTLNETERGQMRDYIYKEQFMNGIVAAGSNEKLSSQFKVNEAVKFQLEYTQKQAEMEQAWKIALLKKDTDENGNPISNTGNGVYITPTVVDVNDEENKTIINDQTLDKEVTDAVLSYNGSQSEKYKFIYGLANQQSKFNVDVNYTPDGVITTVTPKPEFKADIDSQISKLVANKNLANKGVLDPNTAIPGDNSFQRSDESQKESIFKTVAANTLKSNIYTQAERELVSQGKIAPSNANIQIKTNDGGTRSFGLSEINDLFTAYQTDKDAKARSERIGVEYKPDPNLKAKADYYKSLNLDELSLRGHLNPHRNRLETIKSKVDEIYKNVSSVNNPYLTVVALNKKDPNYLNTVSAAASLIQTQFGDTIKGEDINIEGGTIINGKRKLQVTYEVGTGDKKQTKRTFVDVSTLAGGPATWLTKTFYNDANPDLTASIRLSPDKRTPNIVDGSGSISGMALSTLTTDKNRKISRAYQIIQATGETLEGQSVEPGKFYVKVAIPTDNSGKGNFFQPLFKQGYASAGEAQQYINSAYSTEDSAKIAEYMLLHPTEVAGLTPAEILQLANQ